MKNCKKMFCILIGIQLGGILLLLTGCITVIMPKTLTLTGKRTALEKQIIGNHKEIEERNMIGEYTQDDDGKKGKKKLSAWDKKILAALNRSKFNQPEILEYKAKGWIGEGSDAKLHYVVYKFAASEPAVTESSENTTSSSEKKPSNIGTIVALTEEELKSRDPIHVRIAKKVIVDENLNRQLFIDDALDRNPKLNDSERNILIKKIAEKYKSRCKKDEWLQLENGKWMLKGKTLKKTPATDNTSKKNDGTVDKRE